MTTLVSLRDVPRHPEEPFLRQDKLRVSKESGTPQCDCYLKCE
jgi:hypothetical protein